MSSKTTGVLIVIIIVVVGVWLMTRKAGTDYSNTVPPPSTAQNNTPAGTGASGTQTQTGASAVTGINTDTSDTGLSQDSAAIDGEMSGLSSDTSAAAQ